jgi:hypothetical protein
MTRWIDETEQDEAAETFRVQVNSETRFGESAGILKMAARLKIWRTEMSEARHGISSSPIFIGDRWQAACLYTVLSPNESTSDWSFEEGQQLSIWDLMERDMRTVAQEQGFDFDNALDSAAHWFEQRSSPRVELSDREIGELIDDDRADGF